MWMKPIAQLRRTTEGWLSWPTTEGCLCWPASSRTAHADAGVLLIRKINKQLSVFCLSQICEGYSCCHDCHHSMKIHLSLTRIPRLKDATIKCWCPERWWSSWHVSKTQTQKAIWSQTACSGPYGSCQNWQSTCWDFWSKTPSQSHWWKLWMQSWLFCGFSIPWKNRARVAEPTKVHGKDVKAGAWQVRQSLSGVHSSFAWFRLVVIQSVQYCTI